MYYVLYYLFPLMFHDGTCYQWEFQDPKMEVLYHISPCSLQGLAWTLLIDHHLTFGTWSIP